MTSGPAADSAGPSRARRILFGLLAWLVIPVLTIAMLEGIASGYLFARDWWSRRGGSGAITPPNAVPDTLLGWAGRPNISSPNEFGTGIAFSTDTHGFRKSDRAGADSGAKARLLCTGDGYTAGSGVSDAHHWCGLLQGYFPGLETLNLGQSGYGLDQAYLRYRRDGLPISHQVQVVALTDAQFERSISGDLGGRFKPYLVLEGGRLTTRNVPVPPQTSSALQHAATSRSFEQLRMVQMFRKIPAFNQDRRTVNTVDAQWPVFEGILGALASADREHNSELVVVYLPTPRDIRPSHIDDRRRRLASFAQAQGIRFIDLTPAFRALRSDSLDLAFINRRVAGAPGGLDGQYSNLGHAWVARSLASSLATLPALSGLLKTRN